MRIFNNMKQDWNWKKTLLYIFLGAFGLFLALSIYGMYLPQIHKYFLDRRMAALQAETDRVEKEIEQAYQNDFDGGKTPEETISLFLTALRGGDVEKASKYYELTVQQKALTSLKDKLAKNKNFDNTINFFTEIREKGTKKCGSDGCTFELIYITTATATSTFTISGQNITLITPKGSHERAIIDFEQSKYTKVWKITQPY